MNHFKVLAASLLMVMSAHLAKADPVKNIVLVHGGFVDGSGWEGVYNILKKDGYNVIVAQNSTVTLMDDVNTVSYALEKVNGPALLVGHSYGGVVVTEAGNDPKVKGVVYITAFAPDKGESVATLIATLPPGSPLPPILPPSHGFLFLDQSKFADSFAADVDPDKAAFMASSQVPWGVDALQGMVTMPVWKTKPSWYLVATDDKMIASALQRTMATRANAMVQESPGSHAIYVSKPDVVAQIIEKAAQSFK